MITHLVILSFKPEVTDDQMVTAFSLLKNLMQIIPEIQGFDILKNISKESFATPYPYGFIMTFENSQQRDSYVSHPKHIELATTKLLPLLSSPPIVFDYETTIPSRGA